MKPAFLAKPWLGLVGGEAMLHCDGQQPRWGSGTNFIVNLKPFLNFMS